MARSRNIKPGFFDSSDLAKFPPLCRIFFAGLWCHVDRNGRCKDNPQSLKAKILPFDKANVELFLNLLSDGQDSFIIRYSSLGTHYIQVRHWDKHQKPHPKESPGTYPAPDLQGPGRGQAVPFPGSTVLIPSSLIPDSLSPSPRHSAPADAEAGEPQASDCATIPDGPKAVQSRPAKKLLAPDVEVALAEVATRIHERHPKPRRGGIGEVRTRLRTIAQRFPAGERLDALIAVDENHEQWCATADWQKEGGQYAKGLSNWLAPSMERWKAEAPDADGASGKPHESFIL